MVDKKLKKMASANESVLSTLQGHSHYVTSVCYSPDGTKDVSGSEDNTVRIWDTTTGAVLSNFQGHSDDVNAVSYSHDGSKVVSGSDDKTVRIWATTAGNNDDRGTAALKGPAAKISPNLSGSFGSLPSVFHPFHSLLSS